MKQGGGGGQGRGGKEAVLARSGDVNLRMDGYEIIFAANVVDTISYSTRGLSG